MEDNTQMDNGAKHEAKGPNARPKTPPDEKFDRQKKALQKMTVQMLEVGTVAGLTADQVVALKEALQSLGWLPTDVRV